MLAITSIGASMVNSTKAAPAIPSSPTMNLRIACRNAVLFELGVFLDIIVHCTSVTILPIGFCPPLKAEQPELVKFESPYKLIVLTINCRQKLLPPVTGFPPHRKAPFGA